MTLVRRMNPVNRLAALLHKPGGVRVGQAVAAAERNLERARGEALARLDEIVAALEADAAVAAGYDAQVADRMYARSNEIFGIAGLFGFDAMGKAAYSLCELLDRLRTHAAWSPEGVAVHLRAIRLLRAAGGPGADAAACEAVLEGLRQVSARVVGRPAA